MKRVFRLLPFGLTLALLCFTSLFTSVAESPNSAFKTNAGSPSTWWTFFRSSVQKQLVSGQLIQVNRQDPELTQRLRRYDLLRLDSVAAAQQVRQSGRLLLQTSQGNFDLQMVPNDLRAPGYVAQYIGSDGVAHQLPKQPITTYKGIVSGQPFAQARMTINDQHVEGSVIAPGEHYFFEPARSLSKTAAADELVFYRGSDVIQVAGSCGVTLADEIAAQQDRVISPKEQMSALSAQVVPPISPLKVVKIATDADAEYVSAFGGVAAANNQIMNIMNQVDGIYQVEMGLNFQVVFQNAWTDVATQPYTTSASSDLLMQFRTYWNTNFTSVPRSTAHLFTGKDLNGSIIGIAYLAVTCAVPTTSYGLSQRFPTSGTNPLTVQTIGVTAHEIGHGLSAHHTNQTSSEVPPEIALPCHDTIMEASIGGSGSFCQFSRSQIIGHANAHVSCFADASLSPPAPSACSEVPITQSGTINGLISTTDCPSPLRGRNFFADHYSFNGGTGQQVTFTMNRQGTSLDPYLYLISPSGEVLAQDDDSNTNQNALLGPITLPQTGKYILEATSFGIPQTGAYTLNATLSSCSMSVNPISVEATSEGGTSSLAVTGNCGSYNFRSLDDGSQWLQTQITGGSGTQNLNYIVQANLGTTARTGFLMVGGVGNYGGIRVPVVQAGTGTPCVLNPITVGQTLNGTLSIGNCRSPIRGSFYPTARYSFDAVAGQQIALSLSSPSFDTFLTLIGPDGAVILNDDDSGGGTNSRVPGGQGFLTLGIPGTYVIEVNGFSQNVNGSYSLTLAGPTSVAQMNAALYTVNEGEGSVDVTVTRSGDTSTAAVLDFATTGTSSVQCNVIDGNAGQNCDYIGRGGTVSFGPGETFKTLTVLINDDLYVEGNETFTVTLSNAAGLTVGSQNAATVMIVENDSVPPSTNLIDNSQSFVRQHYYDFLNRVPDAGGLAYWTSQITVCGSDPTCIRRRRIDVSNAFFYEAEYQRTGAYVFRLYRAAFGDNQPRPNPDSANPAQANKIPSYAVFVSDRSRVTEGSNLAQSQLDLANQFVQRPEFLARYPQTLSGPEFVDAVIANIRTSGTELGSQQAALLNLFNQGGRGAVLYRLADDNIQTNPINNRSFIDNEYNRAFVFTEYAGYLRRDSDIGGFLFWLNQVNAFPVRDPGIQHAMVCAFITSAEYQQRFSPIVTRSNAECGN